MTDLSNAQKNIPPANNSERTAEAPADAAPSRDHSRFADIRVPRLNSALPTSTNQPELPPERTGSRLSFGESLVDPNTIPGLSQQGPTGVSDEVYRAAYDKVTSELSGSEQTQLAQERSEYFEALALHNLNSRMVMYTGKKPTPGPLMQQVATDANRLAESAWQKGFSSLTDSQRHQYFGETLMGIRGAQHGLVQEGALHQIRPEALNLESATSNVDADKETSSDEIKDALRKSAFRYKIDKNG